MRSVFIFSIILLILACNAPSKSAYEKEIDEYRKGYLAGFLEPERSPLTEADFKYLNFFKPDPAFRIIANYELLLNEQPFEIKTSANKTKPYRKFAKLDFKLNDLDCTLYVYESLNLLEMDAYKNYLFLPFTDMTNGELTYGGGRYMDLDRNDFSNGRVIIDFNKCYNPWCAYSDGFNCPVPPTENDIKIAIEAGESNFSGAYKFSQAD